MQSKTDAELIELCGAIIQYYRETGNYLERTSEWVERMGLEQIRSVVVDNLEERKALMKRIEFALSHVEDPWKKYCVTNKARPNCSRELKFRLALKL